MSDTDQRRATPDPCANRHGGNAESAKAYADNEQKLTALENRVYGWVLMRGERGATADECSEAFDIPVNSISGRFTRLAALGKFERSGKRRPTRRGNGATVWCALPDTTYDEPTKMEDLKQEGLF